MDTTFSTIISLLPFELVETKPGLNPNEYIIRKAEGDKIGLTIIPNNVYYLINPDPLSDAKEVRQIKVPVPSIELAQSLITDYTNAMLGVELPDSVPGLIAVKGDWYDRKEVAKEFMKEIMIARNAQNRWFTTLVAIADDSWSKTQSPLGISDLQRDAVRMLKLERPWLNPIIIDDVIKCPICQSVINPGALKCVVCNTILNKKEYDKVLAGIQ